MGEGDGVKRAINYAVGVFKDYRLRRSFHCNVAFLPNQILEVSAFQSSLNNLAVRIDEIKSKL